MKLFSNVKGDVLGGITSSIIALPMAIAFGIVAFAPLGEAYVSQGALAGLYGVIVAGILTSLLGGTPGQISVPTAPMSVMVTSIIATLLKDPEIAALGENQVTIILLLVAMTIAMAGLLQVIMGAIGGGRLIKFIPYPVIAGFMNGIAIIIFISQLPPLLGVPKEASASAVLVGDVPWRLETVLVGGVTILAMVFAKRLTKALPESLVGLVCGVVMYLVLGKLLNPGLLKVGNALVIGPIPGALPSPDQLMNFFRLGGEVPLHKLTLLVIPALTLSVLASIDTLLTSVVTDMVTRAKHNSTRELLGQGVGNITSAAVGGLPVSGSTLVTLVNVHAGGRTPLAGLVNSFTVLVVILFLGGLVQWLPLAVLAGILIVTSVSMFEFESIHLSLKKSALENLIVILAVTVITVVIDLIVAVLIGLIIAAFLFIKEQIGKTVVRRSFTGNLVHSKKIRSAQAMQILEEKGDRIRVYELNGSLFFGTCDKLLAEMESDLNSLCIILDLKRVHTIDLTGARLLRQIVDRIKEKDNFLVISYLNMPDDPDKERMQKLMHDVGVIEAIGEECVFPDTDHALEWAEDCLIQRELEAAHMEREKVAIRSLSVFRDLTEEQLETVRRYMEPFRYKSSDVVFREGDPGDRIYFILSGGVSVLASISENGRARRLATFGEGVFFGDMAILENQPRSATVRADSDTEGLSMTVENFNRLVQEEPVIASKMLLGMSRELSYRLRLTSIEVRTLAE